MKLQLHIILIFAALLNTKCISQQNKNINEPSSAPVQAMQKIKKIEVTEQTRGTNRIITYTPGSKIVSVNGNSTTSALLPAEWENILKETAAIDLSGISSLKSPTTSRFSDGALSSSLIITTNENTYQSAEFDAGIPPKELEKLYGALMGKQKSPNKNFR